MLAPLILQYKDTFEYLSEVILIIYRSESEVESGSREATRSGLIWGRPGGPVAPWSTANAGFRVHLGESETGKREVKKVIGDHGVDWSQLILICGTLRIDRRDPPM